MRNLAEYPITINEALQYLIEMRERVSSEMDDTLNNDPHSLLIGDMRLLYLDKAIEVLQYNL